jgi:uncharacterized protein (TIGR02284 family)
MNNQDQIEVLNSLIIINNDRIEGYDTASEETEEADLKNLFANLQTSSHTCRKELIAEVIRLGGEVDEGTRVTGKFFRVWMDLKAALSGNDRKTILSSCEYGENVAQETYDDALSGNVQELNHEQKSMLMAQRKTLQIDHEKIKDLIEKLDLQENK